METTNDPNGNPAHTGNCVDGTANGAGLNINGCGDIFVVDFEATAFPFFYEGYNYLYEFAAAGFGPLTPGACAAVPGAPANCKGFKTAENLATPAEFAIRITALPEEVPEPVSYTHLDVYKRQG